MRRGALCVGCVFEMRWFNELVYELVFCSNQAVTAIEIPLKKKKVRCQAPRLSTLFLSTRIPKPH